jgi:NDP-sugar pyrophosphorylase family protein
MVSLVQGAILAAGRGERLRNAAGALPKPLVELNGEPLLLRQARLMAAAGLRRVVAIVNRETFSLFDKRPMDVAQLELIVLDTGNSLETMLAFADYLAPGYFLAATVDAVLSSFEFRSFCSRAMRLLANNDQSDADLGAQTVRSLDGVVAVTRWRGDQRPLFVSLSPTGDVAGFAQDACSLVTAGLYVLHTRLFALAPQEQGARLTALRQWLAIMPERQVRLAALVVENAIDVDEPTDLHAARKMLSAAGEM